MRIVERARNSITHTQCFLCHVDLVDGMLDLWELLHYTPFLFLLFFFEDVLERCCRYHYIPPFFGYAL